MPVGDVKFSKEKLASMTADLEANIKAGSGAVKDLAKLQKTGTDKVGVGHLVDGGKTYNQDKSDLFDFSECVSSWLKDDCIDL